MTNTEYTNLTASEKQRHRMRFCDNVHCDYYYGEIDECMFNEPDVPNNMERKCETMKDELDKHMSTFKMKPIEDMEDLSCTIAIVHKSAIHILPNDEDLREDTQQKG